MTCTYPIVERLLPTNQYSGRQQLAILAIRSSRHPNTIRFSSRVQHNPAIPLDECRSRGRESVRNMLLLWLGNEERYLRLIYLVEEATAQHVKRTISGLVKVECDLCINANTEIVVHVQFVVRQPFYMQSTARITLNINQPTIQKHGLRLLNLQTKGTNSRNPLRNQN